MLGTMDMAQGHIVEGIEHRYAHLVQAAHRNLLRLTPDGSRHKLMGHQYVPRSRIHIQVIHRRPDRLLIRPDLLVRKHMADRRLQKRKEPYGHRTVLVLHNNAPSCSVVNRRYIHPAATHDLCPKSDPFRRVMISADQKNRDPPVRQRRQKSVQHLHCLPGRHGLIINIPGQENAVRLLLVHDPQDLI